MTKVQTILKDYLFEVGALKPIKMGVSDDAITVTESDRAITVTEENRQALFARLLKQTKFNNAMVIAVTFLHFALFGLAIWFVYYYRESFNAVAAILGGSILSLLAITKSLTSLWREKWMLDILISSLPNLTTEQLLTILKSFYYSQSSTQYSSPTIGTAPKGE